MPLIQLFLDICLFRKGPQHAPASVPLFKLVLAAYFAVGVALTALQVGALEGALQVGLEGAMLLGFAWVSLLAAGKTARWLQTGIALLGTDALITSLALPLQLLLLAAPGAGLIHLAMLLLMLWHVGVLAHILRHALSQSLALGLALAIVYVAFSLQILVLLFGAPEAAG